MTASGLFTLLSVDLGVEGTKMNAYQGSTGHETEPIPMVTVA